MNENSQNPILEARNIGKRFTGVVALDSVNLAVRAGKVHAVVGENGAGKSTLMKILSGVYQADSGEISVDGEQTEFNTPQEAEEKGIAIIHQELNLIPALSVAENIFLGREPSSFGFVDKAKMRRDSLALLERLGHPLDVGLTVSTLKISDQQIVEIAKALSLNARVLIMDEPTTALAASDVEKLFKVIRTLTNEGTAIVYISHKMDELFTIADEFTVLRDGKFVGHLAAQETNPKELVKMMVGREITHLRAEKPPTENQELLRVENLSSEARDARGRRKLNDLNFTVHQGEILGIAGLMGAGRTEILESLFGVLPSTKDTKILIDGKAVSIKNPPDAIKNGIALVSEDRKGQGLILGMDVSSNITLPELKNYTKFGFLDEKAETVTAREWIEKLEIKTPSAAAQTVNLSGGNQQKIVLAKWLLTKPRVLLLDEPTKGIDIKGKTEIYRLIEELALEGIGILVVSSELPELLALSDRILVLREGEFTGEISHEAATEEKIIELATIGGQARIS